MNLSDYLTASRRIIATSAQDAVMYSDALLTEGLRQALREYEQYAAPVEVEIPVGVTGQAQSLVALDDLVELILIAWPWDLRPAGACTGLVLRERVVRWRWVGPGVVWIEDGEPAAGDLMLVYYRRRQRVDDLDQPIGPLLPDEATPAWGTVPAEHENLLTLGMAAWAAVLHYRAVSEAVKTPTEEQLRRLSVWGNARLGEFRAGLGDLARAGGVVQPAWGRIGL